MKLHAPFGRKLLLGGVTLAAAICPASAWALIVPPVAPVAESCPVPAQPLFTASKSETILGGERSRLDELRAQQAAPVTTVAIEAGAMLAPAAGPSIPAIAPCASLGVAGLPDASSLTPRDKASRWVSQLAAVSIARRTQWQPARIGARVDVSKPDVFGSIALAIGRTPLDAKWQRAQAAPLPARAGGWHQLIGSARGKDRGTALDLVNGWVNARVSFVDDIVRFKAADRWASAAETLRAGQGDCEDYAIAKMKLLEAAGVPRREMFLVIARDLVRRADHALLVVRNGDRLVVLDNNTDRIVDAATLSDYRPVMSYSAGKAWIHGYEAEPVAAPAPVRMAALGS